MFLCPHDVHGLSLPLAVRPIVFQLPLLEPNIQTLEVPALGRAVQNSSEGFRTETARGQCGRNLLGLCRTRRLDHCQLSITGSHKGNGGGLLLFDERSQSLFKR